MFEHVNPHYGTLHALAALAALLLGALMCAHSKSLKVRHAFAYGEYELKYNMQMLALYFYSACIDFLAVALPVASFWHIASISINALIGWIIVVTFTVRIMKRWNG